MPEYDYQEEIQLRQQQYQTLQHYHLKNLKLS